MKIKKQKIILISIIGLLLIGGGAAFAIKRASHNSSSSSSITTTANENTKGETTKTTDSTSDSSSATSNDEDGSGAVDKNGDATVESTATLLTPTGTFVSNHKISLGNADQLNIQSDCTTTPGASCKITLTKGSVTKTLSAKKTDAGGAAYWSWNVKDLGLTAGSWQVKATVTLDDQTQTAADAMNMEINQ